MVPATQSWRRHHIGLAMPRKLLVIDDAQADCRLIAAIFTPEGFTVTAEHDAASGIARAAADPPAVVILDLRLPDADGLEVLERLRTNNPTLPVILLSGHNEARTAVRAMQLGAFDYLTKPVDRDEIVVVVRRALAVRALELEVEDLRRRAGTGATLAEQMGPGAAVARIIDQVATVAATDFSVLVLGETGTGKELVTQAIHRQSERRAHPLIAIDCGAIPDALLESELFGHERGAFTGADKRKEGRLQLATGGTLFLDEIGNLPLGLQAKLLRVLEAREVQAVGANRATALDVRVVAATNHDLAARIAEGHFRADLYFRLAQYTISVPALRDRPGDVPHLAQRFLSEVSVELRRPILSIAPDALAALEQHDWPGNVRQLRNVIRQAVLESSALVLTATHIRQLLGKGPPAAGATPGTAGRTLKEIGAEAARDAERHAIRDALRDAHGNKSQAARTLSTDYTTLHSKIKRLGIRAKDFAP
jgi:two-component system, NtrC family, response regulator HydG